MRRRYFSQKYNTNKYLTITALSDEVAIKFSSNCSYKIDNSDWVLYEAGCEVKINIDSAIYFKGNLIPGQSGIGRFTISGSCKLAGNCLSMLYFDEADKNSQVSTYAFRGLFAYCNSIVSVSENFLPATTLSYRCYDYMFRDCTSLVNAPELPATTLADYCYSYMFAGCTSLVNAPELHATTLASSCYNSMFYGCTSLTTAPELPATTLASDCYSSMFAYCTSLTTAPELPATTLADYCYDYMFGGCTSLVTASELPATTLKDSCYVGMFYGCTSLTTAPELPATTLAKNCYNSMFSGCNKLNYIKMLATDISAGNCLINWVKGVASRGTFVKNKNATWNVTGVNGVPSGWTIQKV